LPQSQRWPTFQPIAVVPTGETAPIYGRRERFLNEKDYRRDAHTTWLMDEIDDVIEEHGGWPLQ
jgi:hypothetical protein